MQIYIFHKPVTAWDGGPVGGTPLSPPPSQVGPNLPGLSPKKYVTNMVTGRGVPWCSVKTYQPPGLFCAPSCAGHNFDPR